MEKMGPFLTMGKGFKGGGFLVRRKNVPQIVLVVSERAGGMRFFLSFVFKGKNGMAHFFEAFSRKKK